MGELMLINGRFIKDGKEVPLEIGNREQIDCYKRHIKEIEKNGNQGIEVSYDVDINYTYHIRCRCGNYISMDGSLYDVDLDLSSKLKEDVEDAIVSSYKTLKCRECGAEYIIDYDDEYGDMIAINANIKRCTFNPKYDNIVDEILNKDNKDGE